MGDIDRAHRAHAAKVTALKKRVEAVTKLITDGASILALDDAYQAAKVAYDRLEEAHEAYVVEVDATTIYTEGDFLLLPLQGFTKAQQDYIARKDSDRKTLDENFQQLELDRVKVSAKAKVQAEATQIETDKKEKFAAVQAELTAQGPLFKLMCERITKLREDNGMAPQDLRKEWNAVKEERDRLKSMLATTAILQPKANLDRTAGVFKEDVETPFSAELPLILVHLKDYPDGAGAAGLHNVKREAVLLPKFSGKEPNAFLEWIILFGKPTG